MIGLILHFTNKIYLQ